MVVPWATFSRELPSGKVGFGAAQCQGLCLFQLEQPPWDARQRTDVAIGVNRNGSLLCLHGSLTRYSGEKRYMYNYISEESPDLTIRCRTLLADIQQPLCKLDPVRASLAFRDVTGQLATYLGSQWRRNEATAAVVVVVETG